ncbi:hypothetical protein [Saccharothrix sp. 6-C]|uniref:hypothetical protein n=1 Tax=Saccharothrix sp. 6-C TaxID=2781735 RepID=UPI0019174465|nr:hypothetical protein [Saccharothrix sp. 6-C]
MSPRRARRHVRSEPDEGWGTSLVWFANATGGYPDAIRDRLADLLHGDDGLRLDIARYNIGGGNAPDVHGDYRKPGATTEGFRRAPEGTTREDLGWWDPDDPAHRDLSADANQRWWVDRIKGEVTRWDAFSNSPPWFQTVSGYVSGGFDASADQIRADRVDDFATYLVTQLGPDGHPTGGRQSVVLALREAMDASALDARPSAMDETSPTLVRTDWNAYDPEGRAAVDQLTAHTCGTGHRTSARDIAKGADKPLRMSEVGGTPGAGQSFTGMEPGLGHRRADRRRPARAGTVGVVAVAGDRGLQPAGRRGRAVAHRAGDHRRRQPRAPRGAARRRQAARRPGRRPGARSGRAERPRRPVDHVDHR